MSVKINYKELVAPIKNIELHNQNIAAKIDIRQDSSGIFGNGVFIETIGAPNGLNVSFDDLIELGEKLIEFGHQLNESYR